MASAITIEEIEAVHCYDVSIQSSPDTDGVLVLICKEKNEATALLSLLRKNPFDLKVYIDEKSQHYKLVFEFIDSDIAFELDTGLTESNYPPLLKLRDGSLQFISTGVWSNRGDGKRYCEYNIPPFRLGGKTIGELLSIATSVRFCTGTSQEDPSAVVLIFKDYNHILASGVDEAYNKLASKCVAYPHLEIIPHGNKVGLVIWDILIELEISIGKLDYDASELEDFTARSDANHSFILALGFASPDEKRPILVPTTRENFKAITLKGYVVQSK